MVIFELKLSYAFFFRVSTTSICVFRFVVVWSPCLLFIALWSCVSVIFSCSFWRAGPVHCPHNGNHYSKWSSCSKHLQPDTYNKQTNKQLKRTDNNYLCAINHKVSRYQDTRYHHSPFIYSTFHLYLFYLSPFIYFAIHLLSILPFTFYLFYHSPFIYSTILPLSILPFIYSIFYLFYLSPRSYHNNAPNASNAANRNT